MSTLSNGCLLILKHLKFYTKHFFSNLGWEPFRHLRQKILPWHSCKYFTVYFLHFPESQTPPGTHKPSFVPGKGSGGILWNYLSFYWPASVQMYWTLRLARHWNNITMSSAGADSGSFYAQGRHSQPVRGRVTNFSILLLEMKEVLSNKIAPAKRKRREGQEQCGFS